ncbi:MAG TPA: hypothetical protein VGQ91_15745, partial [Ideonella sp.]|nr:hypothetical protein [Ideonella sp.]
PGVLESFTNTFGQGTGSVHIAVVNGNVVQPDPSDVDGDGIDDISNVIELRSPVRVDDQFVAFDRHLPGFIPDLDGDGRGEALDLAIYSRVIGLENVVLDSGTISATRVDHIIAARLVTSKDGQAFPAVSSTQSIWYAPSLGVVRQRLDAPADDGVGRLVSDEKLVDWDGLPGM